VNTNRTKAVVSAIAQRCALGAAVLIVVSGLTCRAQAAFHLWNITQIYSNSSGSLQFIEMFDSAGFQQFVNGQSITVSNSDNTQQNTFTIPSTPDYSATNSFNHALLFGTSGLQAAGGPAPDFIIPNGFLFTGGGGIDFFGFSGTTNDLTYPALPTDGIHALTYNNGPTVVNSPQNFAGQTGQVVSQLVPGDFSGDGQRDAGDIQAMMTALADLSSYQSNAGLTGDQLRTLGDFNGDTSVDNQDLQGLINNLANGGGTSSLSAVPEPSAWIGWASAALGLLLLSLMQSRYVAKSC